MLLLFRSVVSTKSVTGNTCAAIALVVLLCLSAFAHAESDSISYLPIKLRGYGTLSGTFAPSKINDQPVSILTITCDDEAKAKLLQAKYLSDLQVLPGVKPISIPAGQGKLPGFQASDESAFLAAREKKTVVIFGSSTVQAMSKLVESHLGQKTSQYTFAADDKVPMYLDRWDKYGFRFYYAPFTTPKKTDRKSQVEYDPTQDFTFAQKNHAGLQFWQGPFPIDNAEGITNLSWWDWALEAARKLDLPVGINDGQNRASWAYNRYPDQTIQYQPGFLGGWYGNMNFGEEIFSWNAFDAKDQVLAEVQQSLRELKSFDNITSWLEPHEEMGHGVANLFVDYGPVADQGYRKFLKEKYGDVATVAKRWYGNESALKSWDDVKVPELASFLGWESDAIDLTGLWHVSYDLPFNTEAGATTLDDSAWPTVPAPNNAIVRFLPRKPAVFRRHITVDPAWRTAHDKVWLYVWDLNDVRTGDKDPSKSVMVFLNGKFLPEAPRKVTQDHWVALDVSKELVSGDNLVAITLPAGMFNYRVYFSPHEPVLYPNLGSGKNAQWVDFYDWNAWSRVLAVRRGSQMIRQVDPDRGIMLMSPDFYLDGISQVAKEYGGDFHNTGYMGGFWADYLPAVARGLGLPMTVEPGSPSRSVPDFKAAFGRWLSEGTNGIDYFQHEGDILWDPEIKKCFEDHLSLYSSVGKYHPPTAEVAAFYSTQNHDLLGFPWDGGIGYGASSPVHLGAGYHRWNIRAVLRGAFESDALLDSSFERGDAARYKVILDTNTSMIDDKLLGEIETYVRNGGTFVTFVQTGRHSTIAPETWPIEKLTGYHVTSLTQPTPWKTNQLRWAKGQDIFSGDWMNKAESDGLSLKKVAADVQDLAYWKDGSVAIGMRPLGKGMIIEIGCRFTSWGLPDRVDEDIRGYLSSFYGKSHEYGMPSDASQDLMTRELRATATLFSQILKWRGVVPVPAHIEPENSDAILSHFISNNGLYDVWVAWNQSKVRSVSSNILLDGLHPTWAINLLDGSRSAVKDSRLPLDLNPVESAIYLTPRETVASAPQQWFELQRNWWQGTADPGGPLPHLVPKLAVNLTPDWAFHPLDEAQSDISALIDPKTDDSDWVHRELGVFTIPDYPNLHHALFRKTFTVPADWNHGRVSFWLQSWDRSTFIGKGRIYLDGKIIKEASSDGVINDEAGGAFLPGTTHQIAVQIFGPDALLGSRGAAWIAYHPDPVARQDISGQWQTSADGLNFSTPDTLPGPAGMVSRRMVKIDGDQSARTVVVHVFADAGVKGVIINGRFVSRFHHNIGSEINLNITPWVKFGQDNEIMLICSGKGTIKELGLEFHEKGTYP